MSILNRKTNKNIKSFSALTGVFRSHLATPPLCWRYINVTLNLGERMSKYMLVIFALTFSCFAFSQGEQSSAKYVTYGELINSLEEIAKNSFEDSEVLRREFVKLQKSHDVSSSENIYRKFVRVRMAFEATRDSGLWQLRWAVTNKEPNSSSIWSQWNHLSNPKYIEENDAEPTAVAECDELSALFAFISRGLGVKNVGLFWPTWNHTVAVWTTENKNGNLVRIVIPTSQIFISENATLGTKEFDPYKQKNIYEYSRKDIQKDHKISAGLAEMMIRQVKEYGAKPSSYLQDRRNRLSQLFGGS